MEERSSTRKKNKILRFNIERNCPDKVSPGLQGDRARYSAWLLFAQTREIRITRGFCENKNIAFEGIYILKIEHKTNMATLI